MFFFIVSTKLLPVKFKLISKKCFIANLTNLSLIELNKKMLNLGSHQGNNGKVC